MRSKKKTDTMRKRMGKLVQVAGWMSEDEKKKFVEALSKHGFIDGQSDFINKAADALISQSKPGKPQLAQPLCFLTVDERKIIDAFRLAEDLKKKKRHP